MVRSQKLFHPFENIKPVTQVDENIHVKKEIKTVFVSDMIEKYIFLIIN
jgi:hypothetical protein